MSITVDISEARLRYGVIKLAIALVGVFALMAVAASLLAERAQGVAVSILLMCVAFTFLANGMLAVLKIVDWFKARKRQNG
ncbi:MAG: hypothetical protein JWR80_6750 [Bradyrhizobium sp.]|nr:hypothetical protein [Bradyrhizobium sp.]